ncbi:MAG: geranylgeranyl reductase family protein [Actinobacteria bacterium]|nr:geranylgeranyl reductase family protein [Actinomycetota bacterium]
MLTADVAVVGGGPAGVAAAITLARAGRDVVLVDKAAFPRDKCCGDGLTTAALRQYEALGLRPETVASWQVVDDVWVRSPSGHTVAFPLPRSGGTYAAVARRVELDAAFLDVARAAGVNVHDGHAVTGARAASDRVVLEVEGLGPVAARYAIGADGMWSPLRKFLRVDADAETPDATGYLGEWHAFRQYFRGVGPAAAQLWVCFEPDLLPGYAWSFPLPDGRANVGFGIQRQPGVPTRSMSKQWAELLERPHIKSLLGPAAEPEAPHKAWPIPARVGAARLHGGGGRALFVGDAARATDPMTGEGIGQALETGALAAEAILAAGWRQPALAAARYEAGVRRGLAVDHRLARALSRALRHRKGARTAVRVAGASDWTRRNFARWLFEDYPRAVLATPHRWHRGMLSGPGAYPATASR